MLAETLLVDTGKHGFLKDCLISPSLLSTVTPGYRLTKLADNDKRCEIFSLFLLHSRFLQF